MSSGSLVLSKLRVEALPLADEHDHYVIKIKIGEQEKKSDKGHGVEYAFKNSLKFELHGVEETAAAVVEILENGKDKPVVAANFSVKQLLGNSKLALKFQGADKSIPPSRLHLETDWTPKKSLQERLTEEASNAVHKVQEVAASLHPHALTVHETHRPWFMRASYYYDTSKNVYNYTTSFRIVSPFARLGENATNAVLRTVLGRDLGQLDQSLVVPTLGSLDNKVDEAITGTLVLLVKGQNLVLATKDKAVDTTYWAVTKSTETASNVVHGTISTAGKAATAAYDTAASASQYTAKQVKNVTTATLSTVKGTTFYLVSHIPFVGAKLTQ